MCVPLIRFVTESPSNRYKWKVRCPGRCLPGERDWHEVFAWGGRAKKRCHAMERVEHLEHQLSVVCQNLFIKLLLLTSHDLLLTLRASSFQMCKLQRVQHDSSLYAAALEIQLADTTAAFSELQVINTTFSPVFVTFACRFFCFLYYVLLFTHAWFDNLHLHCHYIMIVLSIALWDSGGF